MQIIFKGKELKFRENELFPFLIVGCGELRDTRKTQIKYFVECYERNGNFIDYLYRLNILAKIENIVKNIKEENIRSMKHEDNHEHNMAFSPYVEDYIIKVLFSENNISDISFKKVVHEQGF